MTSRVIWFFVGSSAHSLSHSLSEIFVTTGSFLFFYCDESMAHFD